MTHHVAYYRVSTHDQSIEAQREALGCQPARDLDP